MLTVFSNRPRILNPILSEYCLQTTKEYIRNLVKKTKEERILKHQLLFNYDIDIPNKNNNNPNNIIPFVCFLSITSVLIYFYNIKK